MKNSEYFLIKEWHEHRGQTRENPACLYYGSMIYDYPLVQKVKSYNCYNSRKAAERIAMKHSTAWTRTEVVQVPDDMIIRYKIDKATNTYIPAE